MISIEDATHEPSSIGETVPDIDGPTLSADLEKSDAASEDLEWL